jgi:SAM-dependent methyltransferase
VNRSVNWVATIKENTPMPVRRFSRRMKRWISERRNRGVSPREVFTEIYAKRLWGSEGAMTFYSGPGSDPRASTPYCEFVKKFVADHGIESVADLGCGDFRVGSMIAPACSRYTGVDIVEPLIAQHRKQYGNGRVSFECLDITKDDLPRAELCLIREVLQHLSNAQIKAIMTRTRIYPLVLVTDVQPTDTSRYRTNGDKVHGASSRIIHQSVLRLDQAPFRIANITQVLETDMLFSPDHAPHGTSFKLRTFLIRHRAIGLMQERHRGLQVFDAAREPVDAGDARSLKDLQDIVHELKNRGVALRATEQPVVGSGSACLHASRSVASSTSTAG